MTHPIWSREFSVTSVDELQTAAGKLGGQLAAGDLLILVGDLGAGKTTFTQGLGRGLGVREGIISPTFVLVRNHPSVSGGPALVHVDAYRLGSDGEIDDLDLESTLDDSVTVVEWGAGRVEHLTENRLVVTLASPAQAPQAEKPHAAAVAPAGGPGSTGGTADGTQAETNDDDEPRYVRIDAYGSRWDAVELPDFARKEGES